MFSEYYFEIEHIKGLNNARVDILSQQIELQGTEKPSGAMLKLHEDEKIKYNHPKLATTQEYKALKSNWEQRINEA